MCCHIASPKDVTVLTGAALTTLNVPPSRDSSFLGTDMPSLSLGHLSARAQTILQQNDVHLQGKGWRPRDIL